MQLVIPIEDTSSGADNSDRCVEQRELHQQDIGAESESTSLEQIPSNDAILSMDLRDQFEAMKTVWRQARRGDENIDDSSSSSEQRATAMAELKRKERETAVETAIKVEKEITSWKNSIADLEALLAAEEAQEANEEVQEGHEGENGPPGIREIAFVRRSRNGQALPRPPQLQFPSLPPAVATEDESEETDTQNTLSSTSCTSISK